MRARFFVWTAVLAGLCGPILAQRGPAPSASDPVDFNRDIRPLLAGRCFTCHGPDPAKRKGGLRGSGGLRLDTSAGSRVDLGGHRAIVPGRAAESELLRRVQAQGKERMPPSSAGEGLTAEQVGLLRRWIEQGGDYAEHWSFVPPSRPELPAATPRAAAPWARHPIDRLVAARHASLGLRPNPPADRPTLIRRVSLDLIGLPPTPEEVQRFVSDEDPGAYEKLVDRLLASTRFGEHHARHWLDLARYADSAGYADDPNRTIWAYRDWVVRALNRNLPFDQFTVQQLAGDLLPDPTDDQLIATAFHRNTMTNSEGGTDDEEFRSAAVVDRVNTTMSVWMGTTMACAQCHDHKYDRLSQKEYFQLYAFFNNTQDRDRRDERPTLKVYSAEQRAERARIDAALESLRAELASDTPALRKGFAAWDDGFPRDAVWRPAKLQERRITTALARLTAVRGALPDPKQFGLRLVPGEHRPPRARFVRVRLPGKKKILSLAEVQVFEGSVNVARKGKARQSSTAFGGPARLAIDGNTDGHFSRAKSTTHTATTDDPWWEVDLGRERNVDRLVIWNRSDSEGVAKRLANCRVELLDASRRVLFEETVAEPPPKSIELGPGGARSLPVAGVFGSGSERTLLLTRTTELRDAALEWTGKRPSGAVVATADKRFVAYASESAGVLAALAMPAKEREKGQREVLWRRYRELAPELAAVRSKIAAAEKSRDGLKPYTTVPIQREQSEDQRRKTHVHIRGNFMQKGDEVTADVPSVFHDLPPDASRNRLTFARWLVDPRNPLTARVAVNRLWQQIFGGGLVSTGEDFGVRGELPSHPQLLDFLATEFVASGWDVKQLLREIVTSATYQQSSRADASARRRDPANRWLARGPRTRLSAEMIRDQALALSGLLSAKMFGPPVRPPRPNLGLRAAFGNSTDWKSSRGEDRYRRGIYTFWQRSIPYPSMATFDAPSREVCTIRREPTNTPLQALVTLNDPVYVEAAQALARRILEVPGDVSDRAAFAMRLCVARQATKAEVARLVAMFRHARARYSLDPKAATQMATKPLGPAPEGADLAALAAWTVVANVLLNLDEVLVKR